MDAVLLQLDYWVLGKKELEVQKVSAKTPVHYLNATRLPGVVSRLSDTPSARPNRDSLILVGKTIKEKKSTYSEYDTSLLIDSSSHGVLCCDGNDDV